MSLMRFEIHGHGEAHTTCLDFVLNTWWPLVLMQTLTSLEGDMFRLVVKGKVTGVDADVRPQLHALVLGLERLLNRVERDNLTSF